MNTNIRIIGMTALIACVLVTGCMNPYKSQFDSSSSNMGQRTAEDERIEKGGARAYGYTRQGGNHHNNKTMELSQVTATEIGRMNGVAASHVILTDMNAYVGVVLDDSATGTASRGNLRDTNNTGESEGFYDARDGSRYADPRKMVTDRNSWNTYPDEDDISPRLKQKIALKVRELNPHVQEVFISANRDFVNELNGYAIEHWNDRPLKPYVKEFNRKVARFFPAPH